MAGESLPHCCRCNCGIRAPKKVLFCNASSAACQRGDRLAGTQEVRVSPGAILLLFFPPFIFHGGICEGERMLLSETQGYWEPVKELFKPRSCSREQVRTFLRSTAEGWRFLPSLLPTVKRHQILLIQRKKCEQESCIPSRSSGAKYSPFTQNESIVVKRHR